MNAAVLSLVACGPSQGNPTPTGSATPTHATPTPQATPSGSVSTVVTRGFSLGWERLNHRISIWEMWREVGMCDGAATEDPGDFTLQLGYIGGSWSDGETATDNPLYSYQYTSLDLPGANRVVEGTAAATLSPDDWQAEVQVNAPWEGLTQGDDVVVVITGLRLSTDVPQSDPDYPDNYEAADGYTTKGFGAWIRGAEVTEDNLAVTTWMRFELGPADRELMNDAIPHADVAMEVDWLAIRLGDGASTTAEQGYVLTYPPPEVYQDLPHATTEQRRLEIQGEAGMGVALPGVVGFDFVLFGDIESGDYVRELSVVADLVDYDSATGAAVLDVDGYASNSSLIVYEQMETDFSAEIALIQFDEGQVNAGSLNGGFATGWASICVAE